MIGSVICRIIVLFFVLVAIHPAAALHAQESPSEQESPPEQEDTQIPPVEVKEVVVSATRLPSTDQEVRAVPAKVTVITAEEIEELGAKTVQEALEKATGIVMYDQIGNEFQQTVDLRGFNGQPVPATSVFVDGVRVNEPDFNTINFDLIPLETVERIEILPAASAIYGKNALGGAVNIITKRGAAEREATGEVAFGSFGRRRFNLNTRGPIGKVDYYANFIREYTDGFRDHSTGRLWKVFGKLGYRPTPRTDVNVSYTYADTDLEQAGTLPITIAESNPEANFTPGDEDKKTNHFVRLNGRQGLPLGFSLTANAFYRDLEQESFVIGQNTVSDRNFDTTSFGGAAQLTHDWEFGSNRNTLVLGAELTRNEFEDDFTGFFCSPGPLPPCFPPVLTGTDTDEDVLGLYAQDTLRIGPRLILSFGVRYDDDQFDFTNKTTPSNNATRRFSRVTPRAGLTVFPTPTTSVYFNYTQGFRVPTVDELFTSRGIFGTSDPNLKPVQSDNYELGFKINIGAWGEAVLALFRTDVEDEIFNLCGNPSCSPVAANQNVDKTRRQGIEATFEAKVNQYFDGVVNYTFTEATFQTNFTTSPFFLGGAPFIVNVQSGNTIPLVPKNRLSFIGNFRPVPGLTVSLSGLYVSTQFVLNDGANVREPLPAYFVLNGRVSHEMPVPGGRFTSFLTVNNILNEEYFTFGILSRNLVTGGGALDTFVTPAPSVNVFGGISYRFESFPD